MCRICEAAAFEARTRRTALRRILSDKEESIKKAERERIFAVLRKHQYVSNYGVGAMPTCTCWKWNATIYEESDEQHLTHISAMLDA